MGAETGRAGGAIVLSMRHPRIAKAAAAIPATPKTTPAQGLRALGAGADTVTSESAVTSASTEG